MKKTIFTFVFLLTGVVIFSQATHVYVKTTGSGSGSSWDDATSLVNALSLTLNDGDTIFIAAGIYVPEDSLSGSTGTDDRDKTFELKKNIHLIGGYPADAQDGSTPDPENNPTILSGILDGGTNVYHVVTVTASKVTDEKVLLEGLTIKGGFADGTGSVTAENGVSYNKNQAGALIAIDTNVELKKCILTENGASSHGFIIYAYNNTDLLMVQCSLNNNSTTSASNGGIYVRSANALFEDCTFDSNSTGGVAATIYTYGASNVRAYNNTFSHNQAKNQAGAVYIRNNSNGVFVNCTFYDNTSTANKGGAIFCYDGSTIDLISCTLTKNKSDWGGAINNYNGTMNLTNTIVSGNLKTDGSSVSDITGSFTFKNSIVADSVYDATGTIVPNVKYDVNTLDALNDNGGYTNTCMLNDFTNSNPAIAYGMTVADLSTLGASFSPIVPDDIVTNDQIGLSRSGKEYMGAVVADSPVTHVFSKKEDVMNISVFPNPTSGILHVRFNDIMGCNMQLYDITGRLVSEKVVTNSVASIDMSAYKNGLYLLKIKTKDRTGTYQVVKQ